MAASREQAIGAQPLEEIKERMFGGLVSCEGETTAPPDVVTALLAVQGLCRVAGDNRHVHSVHPPV
ncbi:MAG: hypothetical protein ABW128_16010 [Rhizorhabdus sp.]